MKGWWSISILRKCLGPYSIKFLLILVCGAVVAAGCGSSRIVKKDSHRQHYLDVSRHLLPSLPGSLHTASFARVNPDRRWDLVLVWDRQHEPSEIRFLNYEKKGRFVVQPGGLTDQFQADRIRGLATGDINRDGADDLILVTGRSDARTAWLLINNKKGYFYTLDSFRLPPIYGGMERVDVVDLDQDADLDLVFTGTRVVDEQGQPHRFQAQILINNGKGEYQDLTGLLVPALPPGISGTSFADYNGDDIQDVFLAYGQGQNRLLLNNGLGRFEDRTETLLPSIADQTAHVDWADFDGDDDNDLLVVNRALAPKDQAYSGETSYFLENLGKGKFVKRSHQVLPPSPADRVYLLDANGNNIPDILMVTGNGVNFIQGRGRWKFSVQTQQRLPRDRQLVELSFGDINRDGYLDIFGIHAKAREGRIWLNRF